MEMTAELHGPTDLAMYLANNGGGPLRAGWLYTPVGGMVAICSDTALHLLEFPRRARLALQMCRLQDGAEFGQSAIMQQLQRELTAYFAGKRPTFDTPRMANATPFTQAVWAATCEIAYGATCTYGDMAARLGRPGAGRAVGRANGANPFAIIVPCHRMLGQGGGLTGYAGGLWRKEWLLAHESRP